MVRSLKDALLVYDVNVKARWKGLESALAILGSVSDELKDCLEDEEDSGRPVPFDVQTLLLNVIPPILTQGGARPFSGPCAVLIGSM